MSIFLDQQAYDAAVAAAALGAAEGHGHTATQITGLHAVATTGNYNDLNNKPGAGGGATFARLTADQPFTTTSLANITGLSFAVTAGTLYRFTFDVIFRSAATTTGIGLGISGPAVTSLAATARIPIAGDGAGGELQGWITSSGDTVIGTGVQTIGTDYLAQVEGVVLPSANGTVQLQARSEIAASQITVRTGSLAAWQAIP